jgi:hypothetical protein
MTMSEQKSFPKRLVLIFAIVAAPFCAANPQIFSVLSHPIFLLLLVFAVLVVLFIIGKSLMKDVITGPQSPDDHFGTGIVVGLILNIVLIPIVFRIIDTQVGCSNDSGVGCYFRDLVYGMGIVTLVNSIISIMLLIARCRKIAAGIMLTLVIIPYLIWTFLSIFRF